MMSVRMVDSVWLSRRESTRTLAANVSQVGTSFLLLTTLAHDAVSIATFEDIDFTSL